VLAQLHSAFPKPHRIEPLAFAPEQEAER
jgi:hypothetical protein